MRPLPGQGTEQTTVTEQPDTRWCASADCNLCALRARALFAGIDEGRLNALRGAIEECRLPAGERLYSAGEQGWTAFTVREGLIKLVQSLPSGGRRIVRVARAGDVIGLETLLDEPYQHDAIALDDSLVCRLPAPLVERLSSDQPELHRELLRRWQQALSEADAWLTELSTGPARQRVARLLLRLCDPGGTGYGRLVGREDMAAMLGVTTETASRAIAEFKRAGSVAEGRDGFSCDRNALEKIAAD